VVEKRLKSTGQNQWFECQKNIRFPTDLSEYSAFEDCAVVGRGVKSLTVAGPLGPDMPLSSSELQMSCALM